MSKQKKFDETTQSYVWLETDEEQECPLCTKKDYKRIFQNKDALQVDFINKLQTDKVNKAEMAEFLVSLMCEFVGQNGIKYFELPSLQIVDLDIGNGYYDSENNVILISSSYFEEFNKFACPSLVFLKLVDTLGHEMTHFKQFYALIQRLQKDHTADIENNEFFTQDDEIFDEWTLKAIRATLDNETSKKIRNTSYRSLEVSLNYNKYYLALCEKQARNGGRAFQNRMMDKWENSHIIKNAMWLRAQKLHKKGFLEKADKSYMKNAIKYDRAVTSKFFLLVPYLEMLKRSTDKFHFRQHVMTKAIKALKAMSKTDLVKAYWQAVRDGNDVMLPFFVDIMAERLPVKALEKIMDKTMKIMTKPNASKSFEKTIAYLNILLRWPDYDSTEIATFLYRAIENRNGDCVELFFKACQRKDFAKKTASHLSHHLMDIYERSVDTIERLSPKLEELEGEYTVTPRMKQYREDFEFLANICKIILPFLTKGDCSYVEFSRFQLIFDKHLKLLNRVVKCANDNAEYDGDDEDYEDEEFEA